MSKFQRRLRTNSIEGGEIILKTNNYIITNNYIEKYNFFNRSFCSEKLTEKFYFLLILKIFKNFIVLYVYTQFLGLHCKFNFPNLFEIS